MEEVPRRESAGRWLRRLGPGVLTGAADDDPSGIGTYSQVGAQFGLGMLWTMVLSYPLMAGIQEISARIGRVTGRGIAGNLRRTVPRWLLYSLVGLFVVANTINLGADLGAMAAAAQLLIGHGPLIPFAAAFALISLLLEIFLPYRTYARILFWLTISLGAYLLTVAVVDVDWRAAIKATFFPPLSLTSEYLTSVVAVLGTTISPYLFFWQALQEVHEERIDPDARPLVKDPTQAPAQLRRLKTDTYVGMAASNIVGLFIILTAASTLHRAGVHNIETAADAAAVLRPLAGRFASVVFAAGIIGTGLLAVPVLAGSAAHAFGEAINIRVGLERKPAEAMAFYAMIAFSTLVGLGLNAIHVNPMKALVLSAIVNGVVAVPVMVSMLFLCSNPKVMGQFTLPRGLMTLGWVATAAMSVAVVGMFAALLRAA